MCCLGNRGWTSNETSFFCNNHPKNRIVYFNPGIKVEGEKNNFRPCFNGNELEG